jgi:hypothetical protein
MAESRKTSRAVFIWICFLLIPAGVCMANPIAIDPLEVTVIGAAVGLGIDLVADCLVLALGYMLLKRAGAIQGWGYAWHLAKVFVLGLVVDFFLYSAAGGTIMSGPGVAVFAFLGFASLGMVNYLICVRKDRFSPKEAAVIGVLMGILTNPILFEFCLRAAGFQPGLIIESSMGGF